ncbi:MAG: SPOR domain-containing protein, partial [Pseudolabrys sp.]
PAAQPQRTAAVSPPAEPVRAAPAPVRNAAPAPSANAPLSLNPNAPAPRATAPAPAPTRTANAPTSLAPAPAAPAAAGNGGGSGAYVQVSSQRSEAEAQAAFRALQSRYPDQLASRQPAIRRVDLGAKGIYFRAMIGPLAAGEASELCSNLKAAGGQCIIQRN